MFPLKAEYDRVNHTLAGRREMADKGLLPGQDIFRMPNMMGEEAKPGGFQLAKSAEPGSDDSGRKSTVEAEGGGVGSSGDPSGRKPTGESVEPADRAKLDRSKPWDGETAPRPAHDHRVGGKPKEFFRRTSD